jgi:hypothetical protein
MRGASRTARTAAVRCRWNALPGLQSSPWMASRRGCPKDSKPTSTRMAGAISDWSAEFEDPIELPNGRKLIMLRSAGYRPVLTPCGLI